MSAVTDFTTPPPPTTPLDPAFDRLHAEFIAALSAMRQAESAWRSSMVEHFEGLRTEASTDREYLRYRAARRKTEELGRSVTHYDGGLRVARALAVQS